MLEKDKLHNLVMEGMGRASMCWEPRPTGVFASEEAIEAGRELTDAILAEMDEPLDKLVIRKGCAFRTICYPGSKSFGVYIRPPEDDGEMVFEEDTYAEAESKARAYLEGLPDVKGEGR